MTRVACVVACIGWSSLVPAQDIYKCATGTGIVYQSAPCAAGQVEVALLQTNDGGGTGDVPSVGAPIDPSNGPEPRAQGSDPRLPFLRTTIALGMTDDAVLNTPNWGVPARISRARRDHRWREVWVYAPRAGIMRQLSFENGRLTNIETVIDPPIAGRPAVGIG
jgi:hypothetical protein